MPDDNIEGSTTSVTDDVKYLETEDTAPPVQEPEEEEAPEREEPPEEEPERPDYEIAHPFDRPSLKQINEKYPEFFKAFPQLRDMYFREAEYSKLFPTIEDAREAGKEVERFREIRESLLGGNADIFAKALNDEKLLDNFASQFFPSLLRTKQEAFWAAANPLVEDIARSMFAKGIKEGDENVQNAARHLAEFFFGDLSVAEGKRTFVKQPDPKVAAEASAAEKYDTERYVGFRNTVSSAARDEVVRAINEGGRLDNLSPFLQSVIADKIIEEIGRTLESDKDHLRYMDSLWERAKRNGRRDEDKSRIVSAYLSRAKTLIPSLRGKFLHEVNGTVARASAEKLKRLSNVTSRTADSSAGRVPREGNSYNPRQIDYRRTSDMDILNDDIKYKN